MDHDTQKDIEAEGQRAIPRPTKLPTPGPWSTGGYCYHGDNPTTQNVWGKTPPGKQSGHLVARECLVQDARLISRAPEMMDLLKRFSEWDRLYPKGSIHSMTGERALDALFSLANNLISQVEKGDS